MTRKTKVALAAVLIAAFASPALADDEWIANSGRYVNGNVPSYTTRAPFHATYAPQLIEGRNAAVIDRGSSHLGRGGMVEALGN
jgi:hypothetical protein